ncbi:DUF4097 family beta strand repeat-containing protein [Salinibacter ruber]|uniref:DUF4097 domain-containing protein n=1 Tax=Salinibacter ruber TaxID=146919 RepID=A0AAW5P3S5_9BACT|nr:DUF4097 family beta strand repeat-containing protein [Salinibacter ruber]MCS3663015.1 hypothetical protein [Salinibacter ruber]MCS4156359.1 hypothetical protein [Salinibacter ruber]MCS4176399.1 hypothetical protein [Salinibacter ruber]MCS4222711.1 hypothetical protein [Salinibacter ruber]
MSDPTALWNAAIGLVLSLGIATGAAGQPAPPDTVEDTVRLAPEGAVDLSDTHEGTITVTTWERDRLAYRIAPVSAKDSMVASNAIVRRTDQGFMIDQDGASWSLRIPGLLRISPSAGGNLAAHYHVTMPETATLEIEDYTSTINVSGVEGDVEIDTHAGTVTVDSVDGMLDLGAHSGRITATGIRGGIALDVFSGDASVAFETLSAPSTAETHSGTLRFFLPAEAGFTLQTDLDSTGFVVDEAFGSPSTNDEGRAFNGGGPTLALDAPPGAVTVRPLEAHEAAGPH